MCNNVSSDIFDLAIAHIYRKKISLKPIYEQFVHPLACDRKLTAYIEPHR